jgi:hypothetical protein
MRIGGILAEESHVAHVNVRIDQSGYEKLPAAVDSPCVRAGSEIRADFNNPAIANNDICMEQWRGPFRRDQSDIFDHDPLINDSSRVSSGPSGKQSIVQERPSSHPDICCGLKIIRTLNYTNLPLPKFQCAPDAPAETR